ncbi:MAG: hypothetical protein ABIJ14_03745 [Nanoarchaeota archaeon]
MVDKKEILIIGTFIFSIVILSMFFVLAAHTITTSSGGNSFSVDEEINNLFNITVNNTDAGQLSNITSVNITLPSGASCVFVDGSNDSSVGSGGTIVADTFMNVSNTLSWTNTTGYVVNGSEWKYFWFNATCAVPGTFNITVTTTNVTNSYETNLSFEVNDTTSPTASFGTNPINNYNSSSADVVFDLKCADGYSANDLVLYGNWTSSGWHANQTNASSVNNTFWNITVSGIADGTYVWGVYCNDSAGNSNWSITNRTVTIDTTSPSASPACTPSTVETSETVTCTCGGSDSGSGINSGATSASSTPSTVNSGTFTYGCSVADYAGNTASASATYIVEGQSSSGSSSSGGATSTFSYSKTIPQTAQEFKDIKKIETSSFSGGGLRAKERVKIKFNDEEHFVGIRELTETSATIEIASDPVQVKLDVGEDAKVDFDEDGYYDIYVKLNKIISGKADITIEYLNEIIPEEKGSVETTGEDVTPREEIEKESEPGGKNYTWLWILIIVLVIVVGAGIKYKKK